MKTRNRKGQYTHDINLLQVIVAVLMIGVAVWQMHAMSERTGYKAVDGRSAQIEISTGYIKPGN